MCCNRCTEMCVLTPDDIFEGGPERALTWNFIQMARSFRPINFIPPKRYTETRSYDDDCAKALTIMVFHTLNAHEQVKAINLIHLDIIILREEKKHHHRTSMKWIFDIFGHFTFFLRRCCVSMMIIELIWNWYRHTYRSKMKVMGFLAFILCKMVLCCRKTVWYKTAEMSWYGILCVIYFIYVRNVEQQLG